MEVEESSSRSSPSNPQESGPFLQLHIATAAFREREVTETEALSVLSEPRGILETGCGCGSPCCGAAHFRRVLSSRLAPSGDSDSCEFREGIECFFSVGARAYADGLCGHALTPSTPVVVMDAEGQRA